MDATKVAIKQKAHCVTRRRCGICGRALEGSEDGWLLKIQASCETRRVS